MKMMILVIGLVIVMSIYVPTISSKIITTKTKILTKVGDYRLIRGNITSHAAAAKSRGYCYVCSSPCSYGYCCDGAQCCYYNGQCYCCV